MTRHFHDLRSSSPAVKRARERHETKARTDGTTGRVHEDHSQPSGYRVDLVVHVDDLDDGDVEVRETLPTPWMSELLNDGREPHWRAAKDAQLDLRLQREAAFIHVKGKARFGLVHTCVRCLNDVPFEVPLEVDLRLVERPSGPVEADLGAGDGDDDFEGPPLGDPADLEDLDIASYEGDAVPLHDVLREQLFLELPMHPACDSPRARPTEPCAFDAERATQGEVVRWRESRWGSLMSLRDQLPSATTTTEPKDAASDVREPARSEPSQKQRVVEEAPANKAPANKAPAKKARANKAPANKAASARAAKKKASRHRP